MNSHRSSIDQTDSTRKTLLCGAALAIAGLFVSGSANAAVLVHWEADDTPGAGGTDSVIATSSVAGITGSDMQRWTGSLGNAQVQSALGPVGTSLSGTPVFRSSDWGNTATRYYAFSITAGDGKLLDITDVKWIGARSQSDRSASYRLDYSTDNSTFTGGTTFTDLTGDTFSWKEFSQAVALQDVTEAYFRLYVWAGASAAQSINVDDIRIFGDVVPVPEPATAGLLAVAGLLALRRRSK